MWLSVLFRDLSGQRKTHFNLGQIRTWLNRQFFWRQCKAHRTNSKTKDKSEILLLFIIHDPDLGFWWGSGETYIHFILFMNSLGTNGCIYRITGYEALMNSAWYILWWIHVLLSEKNNNFLCNNAFGNHGNLWAHFKEEEAEA